MSVSDSTPTRVPASSMTGTWLKPLVRNRVAASSMASEDFWSHKGGGGGGVMISSSYIGQSMHAALCLKMKQEVDSNIGVKGEKNRRAGPE